MNWCNKLAYQHWERRGRSLGIAGNTCWLKNWARTRRRAALPIKVS